MDFCLCSEWLCAVLLMDLPSLLWGVSDGRESSLLLSLPFEGGATWLLTVFCDCRDCCSALGGRPLLSSAPLSAVVLIGAPSAEAGTSFSSHLRFGLARGSTTSTK